jgi:hypothetical protein
LERSADLSAYRGQFVYVVEHESFQHALLHFGMRKLILLATLCSAPAVLAQSTPSVVVPKPPITVKVAPVPLASPVESSQVDPAHAATPAQIREYLALLHVDAMVKRLLTQFLGAMKSTAPPYIPDSVWEDMQSTFNSVDFISGVIPIYQKHLTSDDLTAVLAFYHTPAGQHLLENQQVMSVESQEHFQKIGAKLGEEVAERHKDEIAAAQKKYEEKVAAQHTINPN